MAHIVGYDTSEMAKISSGLLDDVNDFKTNSIDKFFDAMNTEIGADSSHLAWYGDQAKEFIEKSLEPKRAEFKTACDNVVSYAENLGSQARAWDSFEAGK